MNAYQEMPKEKNDRRDEVKTLLTNLRNYHMRLVVYRNIYKRPELDSNELSEKVEFIKHFLHIIIILITSLDKMSFTSNALVKQSINSKFAYSSIGSKEEETKYEEALLDDSVIMTIYNKPFLVDGSPFNSCFHIR